MGSSNRNEMVRQAVAFRNLLVQLGLWTRCLVFYPFVNVALMGSQATISERTYSQRGPVALYLVITMSVILCFLQFSGIISKIGERFPLLTLLSTNKLVFLPCGKSLLLKFYSISTPPCLFFLVNHFFISLPHNFLFQK